jgi:hypothetical protein
MFAFFALVHIEVRSDPRKHGSLSNELPNISPFPLTLIRGLIP